MTKEVEQILDELEERKDDLWISWLNSDNTEDNNLYCSDEIESIQLQIKEIENEHNQQTKE